MTIPRIYIAGAYTGTEEEIKDNVRRASALAYNVAAQYCHPVVPHLVGQICPPNSWEWWCKATMREMLTCDAVLVVPPNSWDRPLHWKPIHSMGPNVQDFLRRKFLKESSSKGTKLEIKGALKKGLPLFFTVDIYRLPHAFVEWLEGSPQFKGRIIL